MEIKFAVRAAGAAFAIAVAAPACAHGRGETVTPHFERAIPNIPGSRLCAGWRLAAAHARKVGFHLRLCRVGRNRVAGQRPG
jgi:hypothetical protein